MQDKPTHVRYLVLLWMCVFAMVAYVHRSCLAVPSSFIEADLEISRADMAVAMSMFLWGYAALQLPGGMFGDRWGSRLVVPILVVLSSAATGFMGLAFGVSQALGLVAGLVLLISMRFLMGAAQAGLFPCAVLTFAQWFPKSERAFPSGMLASFMSVGAVIGSALTGLLLIGFHWGEVFVLFSLPGVALAAWFYVWFRDRPAEHPSVNDAELQTIRDNAPEPLPTPPEPTPWRRILTDPRMWLVCGQQFFRAAGYIFYLTWFPRFLQEARGVGVSESGYLTSLPLLGVVLGSASGGLVTDWIYRKTGSVTLSRKGIAIGSLLLCGLFLAVAYFTTDPLVTVFWLVVSSFFAGLCGPSGYTVTIDLGGKHVATVFSLMNMAGNIGASLLPLAVNYFEDWVKNLKLSQPGYYPGFDDWLDHFTLIPSGWNEVLLFLAALYALAALCWLLLKVEGSLFQSAG